MVAEWTVDSVETTHLRYPDGTPVIFAKGLRGALYDCNGYKLADQLSPPAVMARHYPFYWMRAHRWPAVITAIWCAAAADPIPPRAILDDLKRQCSRGHGIMTFAATQEASDKARHAINSALSRPSK